MLYETAPKSHFVSMRAFRPSLSSCLIETERGGFWLRLTMLPFSVALVIRFLRRSAMGQSTTRPLRALQALPLADWS